MKPGGRAQAESSLSDADHLQLRHAVVLDDLQLKPNATASAGADSDNSQPIDPPANATENGLRPHADPEEATRDERLRRVEAQLEGLLTLVLPEGSPPSYTE
jgi:hypothetical protein